MESSSLTSPKTPQRSVTPYVLSMDVPRGEEAVGGEEITLFFVFFVDNDNRRQVGNEVYDEDYGMRGRSKTSSRIGNV